MISDPKALQYIHQTSGYHFQKQPERRVISEAIAGKGIIWADGKVNFYLSILHDPSFSFTQGTITEDTARFCYPGLVDLKPKRLLLFLVATHQRYVMPGSTVVGSGNDVKVRS